jgi:beta-xylosidase
VRLFETTSSKLIRHDIADIGTSQRYPISSPANHALPFQLQTRNRQHQHPRSILSRIDVTVHGTLNGTVGIWCTPTIPYRTQNTYAIQITTFVTMTAIRRTDMTDTLRCFTRKHTGAQLANKTDCARIRPRRPKRHTSLLFCRACTDSYLSSSDSLLK